MENIAFQNYQQNMPIISSNKQPRLQNFDSQLITIFNIEPKKRHSTKKEYFRKQGRRKSQKRKSYKKSRRRKMMLDRVSTD